MNDLFARVRPMVGEVLQDCRVAVFGSSAAGDLVEYWVACGVRHWVIEDTNEWFGAIVAQIVMRYGDLVEMHVDVVDSSGAVGAVDLALVVDDGDCARGLPTSLTRLAVFTPTVQRAGYARVAMPGEVFGMLARAGGDVDSWDWATFAPLVALMARALLLRGTAYSMGTWEDSWAKGQREYSVGSMVDPTGAAWQMPLQAEIAHYRTPRARRGTLMVVGLGSLGSVAAWQLAPFVERLVLVDGDVVEVANLVRQRYAWHEVGVAKAAALADALRRVYPGLRVEVVVANLGNEQHVASLVAEYGVSAALVTTGTVADFAIARALRAAAIAHVVGRCYARARFWEGVVVDGQAGPSYELVRRTVALGPTPLPTPEEVAAYGAVGELVAEPATAMECGWAAMWLARLAAQLLVPVALREGWFLTRMAAEASCFVGGLVVEEGEDGAAYGVCVPGMVHAWTLEDVAR